jgi:SNF2 family DNA or RNA helicase
LILSELIQRRRVRRVLIICPASLRGQWRQEMRDKFSLAFDEVDREATHALRRNLGLDASPWRTFPRIVTSYDYLKQPDVLEEFRSASRVSHDSPHLPWDLLIVDEAHNLAPAAIGDDSEVSRMLGILAPLFEHKLLLTATPHNGHTRSFSGLLEDLDPVRWRDRLIEQLILSRVLIAGASRRPNESRADLRSQFGVTVDENASARPEPTEVRLAGLARQGGDTIVGDHHLGAARNA